MPVQGTPAFDAVALLEVEAINFVHTNVRLVAHGAFVSTKTGNTYGSTTCERWSKQTIELLKSLRESMENDLAALVFETGSVTSSTSSGGLMLPDPGGIGEHAGKGDADQA